MRQITNIRIPQPISKSKEESLWWVLLNEVDQVCEINPMNSSLSIKGESWHGDWLSPMGIDLQINGGLGISFSDLNNKDLPTLKELLKILWRDGVEYISPTIISCEVEKLRNSLKTLRAARTFANETTCRLIGAHLEGPFISTDKKGAHPIEHICKPSLSALQKRINGFEHEIQLVTLAPELSGANAIIRYLKKLKIIVCLGHSMADAQIAARSFQEGVSMLTHTFNGMQGLHHRAPGPITAALANRSISLGLIADGMHVDPAIATLLQRLSPDQIVLVSDSLSPYGLKEGRHHFGGKILLIENDTCRLEDGRLAGTKIPLLDSCKNLALWTANPSAAIWSATMAPRQVLDQEIGGHQLIKGKSFRKLLRWHAKEDGKDLTWQHAS